MSSTPLKMRAEARLKSSPRMARVIPPTIPREEIIHELNVQNVELEMQYEELRRRELELEKSREQIAALYDHAPVAYLMIDSAGRIVEANFAAADLLGIDRSLLLGKPLAGFMTPSDADSFYLFRQEVLRSRVRRTCDITLLSKDGPRPIHLSADVAANARNGTSCRCALFDLSALHGVATARDAAEATMSTIVDTAFDAILTLDEAGCVRSFNPAAERMSGHAREDVVGRSVVNLLAAPFRETCADVACRLLDDASDPPRIVTVQALRKNGSSMSVEVKVTRCSNGGASLYVVIARDVSERDATLRRMHASEELLRSFTDHIEDVFYVLDADGHPTYVSPAVERIWNRSLTDLREWPTDVHPDDQPYVRDALAAMRRGDPYDLEYRVVHANGDVRFVHDRAFPIEPELGRIERVIGVARDRTAEREIELELQQAQKMEVIGTLASGIAHDFNNILQVVTGCATLAAEPTTDIEAAREMMRRAKNAALRGGALTHRLGAFVRKAHIKKNPIVLDTVIEQSTELLQSLLGPQIELSIECHAPRVTVFADAVQIEQVLLNLASNARDAMPDGGTLTLRTDEIGSREGAPIVGHCLRVVVADTGCGMDAATKDRIFDPYFTTKKEGHGTGLGLSTVANIARGLGASVHVESERGFGTRFILDFPIHGYEHAGPEHARSSEPVLRARGEQKMASHASHARSSADHRVRLRRRQVDGTVNDFEIRGRTPAGIGWQLTPQLRLAHQERGSGIWSAADPELWIDDDLIGYVTSAADIAPLARAVVQRLSSRT